MHSLSIQAPKLLPPYRGVAKVPLPEGLVCFAIVSHHELEWLLVLHHNRNLIALVYLVLERCESIETWNILFHLANSGGSAQR